MDNETQRFWREEFREIKILLKQILAAITHKSQSKPRFDFGVGPVTNKESVIIMPLAITINNLQKVLVTLNPVDNEVPPQPAEIDNVVWSVVSGDSTVVPAADGLSAELVSGTAIADTVFNVSGDVDPGPGVQNIQDTITLTVTHPFATNMGLTAGTPENK